LLIPIIFLLGGVFHFLSDKPRLSFDEIPKHGFFQGSLEVTADPQSSSFGTYRIEARILEGQIGKLPVKGMKLRLFTKKKLLRGEVLSARGGFRRYEESDKVRFDIPTYLYLKDIIGYLRSPQIKKQKRQVPESEKFRHSLIRVMTVYFPSPEKEVFLGTLFGLRGNIPQPLVRDFQKCGVIHILSVSGLHVGLLFMILHYLFLFLGLSYYKRQAAIFFLLWAFAWFTNGSPPVFRSTLMASFYIFAQILDRDHAPIRALLLSFFFIVLWNPHEVWDIGFELSFLATAGIVITFPLFRQILSFLKVGVIRDPLAIGIAAQLFSTPRKKKGGYRWVKRCEIRERRTPWPEC